MIDFNDQGQSSHCGRSDHATIYVALGTGVASDRAVLGGFRKGCIAVLRARDGFTPKNSFSNVFWGHPR